MKEFVKEVTAAYITKYSILLQSQRVRWGFFRNNIMFHIDILQDKKNIVSNHDISAETSTCSLISQDWKRQVSQRAFQGSFEIYRKAVI